MTFAKLILYLLKKRAQLINVLYIYYNSTTIIIQDKVYMKEMIVEVTKEGWSLPTMICWNTVDGGMPNQYNVVENINIDGWLPNYYNVLEQC
jgi:hypothetical protein